MVDSVMKEGAKMEKIIIRKKILSNNNSLLRVNEIIRNKINQNVILENKEFEIKYILTSIFGEEFGSDFQLESLYKSFYKIKIDGQENDFFMVAYKISDKYCVTIDSNIHIHRIVDKKKIENENLFPWDYVKSDRLFGDRWCDDDETIISNMNKMSFVDFVLEYKSCI